MTEKSGYPYFEVQFTKNGEVYDESEVAALRQHLVSSGATDLLVIAHGWNNDMSEARRLYEGLLSELRNASSARRVTGVPRHVTVLAVLWPSKKFADAELTASGAAGISGLVTDDVLRAQLEQLGELLDDPAHAPALERAKALIPRLEDSPRAQSEFADLVRGAVGEALEADGTEDDDAEDASASFFTLPGADLMDRLARPVEFDTGRAAERGAHGADDVGGAARLSFDDAGGAAGIADFLSGIRAGAGNLLNYATFYSMKRRAGTVGSRGLHAVLHGLTEDIGNLHLHLVGHSFGARLVTAATAGHGSGPALNPHSMVLLQAAFSHNGFAKNFDGKGGNGAFREVVSEALVAGPIVVTHTRNDRAVGLAYPLASLISGSDSAGIGDENDRFGGMGRNGAQFTPEAVIDTLRPVDHDYRFENGRVYNLRADSLIAGHSDIVKPEVAHVILAALAAAN